MRLTIYFGALVVVVALGAAAALAYIYVQTDRDSRRIAGRDTSYAAGTAARQLGNTVAVLRKTVTGLAATPNIEQAAVQPTCNLAFGVNGDAFRGHLDVLRPDGSVACSSRPSTGAPLAGYTGASWLRQARAGPILLAPIDDTATGDRAVLSAAPTPKGWIVVTLVALEPVGKALVALYGGGRPIEFLITSRDGRTVVARSIDAGRWIGAPLSGTPFGRAAGGSERRDLDGMKRLYKEAVVPGAGWKLYAGEDKAAALAAGSRLRERQRDIILVGLAFVLLASLMIYQRVAVPIKRLGKAVRSTSALSPPDPVPLSGPAEVTALGEDINGLISSVSRELTQRLKAEKTALDSEQGYRHLFESSPLPMWIHDVDTLGILEANAAAMASYGYSRDEFLALRMSDIEVSGEPAGAGADALATMRPPGRSRNVTKDGREIDVRTFAHAVVFDGHSARCVVAEDVGERERLETQLRQAQKMQAMGLLAGGIAHDFNNLVMVILGYGEIAQRRIGAGPGAIELAEIGLAAERATQLTRQLLAFSRQQVLDPDVLDLNQVISVVMPMLGRLIGEDIQIVVLNDDDVGPVMVDRGQIEQVILNLALNARDAMPAGGTLMIETRKEELDATYAAEHAGVEAGVYSCLAITDTGDGMDAETQSRIFEPFFTTKDVGRGTGLGLATVHGIVNQAGGHVNVYSELRLGTTFKVYLPVTSAEAVDNAYTPEQTSERLGGTETILVCEDDDLVRGFIKMVFTEHGYNVLYAALPQEALDLAAAHPEPIDLLVTDVVMPQMSGPELAERLITLLPGLKVVFMSGYTAEAIRSRGDLPPGSVFLEKSSAAASLVPTIHALLNPGTQPARRPDVDSAEPTIS